MSFTASAASCIRTALRAHRRTRSEWSLADTALLNDAYRTLKDPLHSTEYLLKLDGAEIGEEHRGKDRKDQVNTSRVPADLLEEVFELNMQLEEMRMARKMGEEGPGNFKRSERAKKKFDGLLDDVDLDLRAQWQLWDAGDTRYVGLRHRRRWWPCSTGGATSATWFAMLPRLWECN